MILIRRNQISNTLKTLTGLRITPSTSPFVTHANTPNKQHRRWTEAERQLLDKAIQLYGRRWVKISQLVFKGQKTAKSCNMQFESNLARQTQFQFNAETDAKLCEEVDQMQVRIVL
jgi:hypothetical protein